MSQNIRSLSADHADPPHDDRLDVSKTDYADPGLTQREVQVLRAWLLLDSKTAAAAELGISLGTVNTHISRIRTKYASAGRAARTKAALVVRALQDHHLSLMEL
ncbi:helix-turn-helix transcriptional regulator [Gordonia sp. L191]|nr:helix-turn-helix transcriptional regulator [Gordonia sp. L191]WHU47737.1 helix-turn-helix transcriptional regulator [Gordonia sp. L191]